MLGTQYQQLRVARAARLRAWVTAQEVQAPAPGTTDHQQMMQGGGMPMMEMMQQMSRMMDSCNKMMQSHMDHPQPNK